MAKSPRRRRRWPVILAGIIIGLILVGGAGFVGASLLEEHDTFCGACHTVPETTYIRRTDPAQYQTLSQVTDLATAHYARAHAKGESFSCIQCHRGDASLGQRTSTLALGGRDLVIYIAGKADSTLEKGKIAEAWLPNAACVACHRDTLLTYNGLDNHFHNNLPQAAQAFDQGGQIIVPGGSDRSQAELRRLVLRTVPTSVTCTDCHNGHKTVAGVSAMKFLSRDTVGAGCDTCHRDARRNE